MYKLYKNKKNDWKKTEMGSYVLDLPSCYEPIKICKFLTNTVGKGSYGVVVAAKDHNN